MVTTDNASYSDMVFGVFDILGYRFSPRFADLPEGPRGAYGPQLPDGIGEGVVDGAPDAWARQDSGRSAPSRCTARIARMAGLLETADDYTGAADERLPWCGSSGRSQTLARTLSRGLDGLPARERTRRTRRETRTAALLSAPAAAKT